MERRGFLRDLVATATLLAAAALPYGVSSVLAPGHATAARNHLRPPGALADDAAFVAACIGCGLCGEVCPPRCILFHARDGGTRVNTPYIDSSVTGCILCNKCMEVCPTEALTVIPRQRVDMGIAQIDRTACYPWVDRGVCGACVSICPLGGTAIGFKLWNQYRPFIKDGCVGCGLCVEVCPHPSQPIWVVDRARGTVAKHRG
jgi:ferredoxin-type protein NapG